MLAQGNIAAWKKKEGDEIAAGDVLCEVETDKVCYLTQRELPCYMRHATAPLHALHASVGIAAFHVCKLFLFRIICYLSSDINVPMGSSHCPLALIVCCIPAGHNGVGGTG